LIEI